MPSALVPLYVTPGEQYYLSVSVTLSGGAGVIAGIQFAFDDGSFLGPDLPVSAGPNIIAQLVTIPAGVHSAYMRLIVSGLSGANTAIFTNPVLYITAGPNQLQSGSVTNAAIALGAVSADSLATAAVTTNKLAANSVDASKIVANTIGVAQLQAGIVYAGIVNGTVIEGSYFIGGSGGGTAWQSAVPTTPGYFLYYDDGIASPVIVFAVTAAAGSDQWGNTWPGGAQFTGLPTSTNLLAVVDSAGDTLLSLDNAGNIHTQTASATVDLIVAGQSIPAQLASMSHGMVNRGWTPGNASSPWPSVAIGTSETAILELDFTIPAGRAYKLVVLPCDILTAAAAGTQHVFRLKYTTDGTVPTTTVGGSVSEVTGHSPAIMTNSASNLNYMSPYMEWIPPTPSVDTTYRMLLSANCTANTFRFANNLEMQVYDLGADVGSFSNAGYVIGSGTTGGGSGIQTYVKTYYATASHSYYGVTAGHGFSPNGKRSDNATMWQGCPSGRGLYEGDQYSFAVFNHGAIAADLSGAVINSFKLRLTNLTSYYAWGVNAILGATSYTGVFGDPFIPGLGTTENIMNFPIGSGATLLTELLGSGIDTGFQANTLGALVFGTSASFTVGTDLSNFGSFFGYSATNHVSCPALIVNYTKLGGNMRDLQISGGDLTMSGSDLGTVTGAGYIRQRIATALAEPYGSDPFQPAWGSVLDSWIGQPIRPGTDAMVGSEVSRVLAQLIAAQRFMITSWSLTGAKAQLAAADTIASVDGISTTLDIDPEAIDVLIMLTTGGGQQISVARTVTAVT